MVFPWHFVQQNYWPIVWRHPQQLCLWSRRGFASPQSALSSCFYYHVRMGSELATKMNEWMNECTVAVRVDILGEPRDRWAAGARVSRLRTTPRVFTGHRRRRRSRPARRCTAHVACTSHCQSHWRQRLYTVHRPQLAVAARTCRGTLRPDSDWGCFRGCAISSSLGAPFWIYHK